VSAQSPQFQHPGWFVLGRDVLAFTLPWLLIFKQAGIVFTPPAEISQPMLWLAAGLLGVPGGLAAWSMRSGAGTPSSPSGEVPSASPASPSSPSTSAGEA
jgi:hypothetical protein